MAFTVKFEHNFFSLFFSMLSGNSIDFCEGESENHSVLSDYLQSHGLYIQSMEFSRSEYWSGQPFHSPGDLPNPGIEARSPALQADSLPAEPQGKPKNTGVGSLSLLQRIFHNQELNWNLLHCMWILYQLSYQGSPRKNQRVSQNGLYSYRLSISDATLEDLR